MNRPRTRAFTLIELLISMTIIVILIGSTFLLWTDIRQRAWEMEIRLTHEASVSRLHRQLLHDAAGAHSITWNDDERLIIDNSSERAEYWIADHRLYRLAGEHESQLAEAVRQWDVQLHENRGISIEMEFHYTDGYVRKHTVERLHVTPRLPEWSAFLP